MRERVLNELRWEYTVGELTLGVRVRVRVEASSG